jgi:hypothetical protein
MLFPFYQLMLQSELTTAEVPGTIYGLLRKGWIDWDLFDLSTFSLMLASTPVANAASVDQNNGLRHMRRVRVECEENDLASFTLNAA